MIRHTCRSDVPERWCGLVVVEVLLCRWIRPFSRFAQVLHLARERCIVSSFTLPIHHGYPRGLTSLGIDNYNRLSPAGTRYAGLFQAITKASHEALCFGVRQVIASDPEQALTLVPEILRGVACVCVCVCVLCVGGGLNSRLS